MPMVEADTDFRTTKIPPYVRPLVAVLALVALGISAYLTFVSIDAGRSPAGCGSGSGCAEVLGSKWSYLGRIPVSVLAMVVYALVMASLPSVHAFNHKAKDRACFILALCAVLIITSAMWFITLQALVVRAFCPYCMLGHLSGVVLAALLLAFMRPRKPGLLVSGAVGLALASVMILAQVNSTTAVQILNPSPPRADSDNTSDGTRTVTVLDGQLTLDINNEPHLGDPDAEHILVMMLDYACLHCRHTHGVIEQVMADRPGWLAVVLLPTPLNHKCNPHAPEELDARFDESCELAEIALAVFLADGSAFKAFDRWLYETPAPRTAEEARAEAVSRVGQQKYEQSLADPRMQQIIARNVYAYGRSGSDRVPVLVSPGRPAVVGRVDDVGLLIGLLDGPPAEASQ